MKTSWERVWQVIGMIPILQARFVLWSIAFLWTTARYLLTHGAWVPSLDWLGFLAAMAGIDFGHFWAKRVTDTDHVTAVNGAAKDE